MNTRRIQLIAGSTYTVSLPKDWISKNKLKSKDEVSVSQMGDGNLLISPKTIKDRNLKEISLNLSEYAQNIDQVLFETYYLGFETIHLTSNTPLSKEVRAKVRKVLTRLVGTEISYEDSKKITITVLLDKSKVDLIQILYRIFLLIESSITNLVEGLDINEIKINENEIDRLYHLNTKIISLSLTNSEVLSSSKIRNVSLIPSYFLISKKLENMGDAINHMAKYIVKSKYKLDKKEVLGFFQEELSRSIKYILKGPHEMFVRSNQDEFLKNKEVISKTKDKIVESYFLEMLRYLEDVQIEIVNISFFNKLYSHKEH